MDELGRLLFSIKEAPMPFAINPEIPYTDLDKKRKITPKISAALSKVNIFDLLKVLHISTIPCLVGLDYRPISYQYLASI